LGKDIIFTDRNLKYFDNFDLAWNARKNIWISRYRYEQPLKAGEIIDVKVVIEWNGIETIINGKIYSLWNFEAVNKYLSMLTGLKRKEFNIWVNGAEWKDKF
jgi:hypothetical protein